MISQVHIDKLFQSKIASLVNFELLCYIWKKPKHVG